MHQDIMDALNLAGRRRGYDDGGTVANNMMSDDPTQQFMANLARAGFTQDQINSIIGSQSPQTNQTPAQALQSYPPGYFPDGGSKPGPGQPGRPIDQTVYPGGSPIFPYGDQYDAGQNEPVPMPPRPQPFYPGEGSGIYPSGGPTRPLLGSDPATWTPRWLNSSHDAPVFSTGTKAGGGAPMGGGAGGQMTPEEWSRTYGPNVDPDPSMIRQSPSQGNLGNALNTFLNMRGNSPIQGAYGNPQYAPLGGGSKAGGPTNPFTPNMPGGYGAPPSGYFSPQGGAGHKGGGAGHKGGGGGGMFGG